jgi:outer membrane protein TolC
MAVRPVRLATGLMLALWGLPDRVGAQEPALPTTDLPALPIAETPSATGLPLIVPPPSSFLSAEVLPIDLNTALRLANVQNPELLIARQRVLEAEATRQLAAAQFLPTINLGTNYDAHGGNLQQSNGNILSVNRSALYIGGGSNAIAAGTVNIPGVVLAGNVATNVYGFLASRQLVVERQALSIAVRNQTFLGVTLAYSELLRAEGRLALARQIAVESRQIAKLTADYAAAGTGRLADADRAATELARRESEVQSAEGDLIAASARLAQVLNLDPSTRLHPTDAWVVPHPIVPNPLPLAELIAVALLNRPELAERRAAIREALYMLDNAKLLPFSPNYLLGYSAGAFGGGSNLVRPVFGGFGGRTDVDVLAYWTIQGMGIGNAALIRAAQARLQTSRFEQLAVLNRVRAEVADAYAAMHARFAQIGTLEKAVQSGARALQEDYGRILARGTREVLPIELLDSFRLKAQSRYQYLDAIVDYNRAQFSLYVALGQPPADLLAHPVPTEGIEPLPMDSSASTDDAAPAGTSGPLHRAFPPGRTNEPEPAPVGR